MKIQKPKELPYEIKEIEALQRLIYSEDFKVYEKIMLHEGMGVLAKKILSSKPSEQYTELSGAYNGIKEVVHKPYRIIDLYKESIEEK